MLNALLMLVFAGCVFALGWISNTMWRKWAVNARQRHWDERAARGKRLYEARIARAHIDMLPDGGELDMLLRGEDDAEV